MTTQFAISRVPEPHPVSTGRPRTYPYADLEIGESFFIPGKNDITMDHWQRNTNYTFRSHRCTEDGVKGVRIFRVA